MGYLPCPMCNADDYLWDKDHKCNPQDIIDRIELLQKRNWELERKIDKYRDGIDEILTCHADELTARGTALLSYEEIGKLYTLHANVEYDSYKRWFDRYYTYISMVRWLTELFVKKITSSFGNGKLTRADIIEQLRLCIVHGRDVECHPGDRLDMTTQDVVNELKNS